MKRSIIFVGIAVLVIVLAGCTVQMSNINNNQVVGSQIPDQEKCEDSGGTWDEMCYEGDQDGTGARCEYSCDCTYTTNYLKNNECISCQTDQECGGQQCEAVGNKCYEIENKCLNGKCVYSDEEFLKGYECQNNTCQSI